MNSTKLTHSAGVRHADVNFIPIMPADELVVLSENKCCISFIEFIYDGNVLINGRISMMVLVN
jgi:hypothetical protein